ncbi:Inner membrane protein YqjF [compost metagenome]
MGMPLPTVGVAVALVIELLGGLALLVGLGTRWAALALAVFTLVASFFFHAYWSLPAEQQMMQQLMFFKNVAITGGLLAFVAFGAGAFSLDARRKG